MAGVSNQWPGVEHDSYFSNSINDWVFLYRVRDYQLLTEDSVPRN